MAEVSRPVLTVIAGVSVVVLALMSAVAVAVASHRLGDGQGAERWASYRAVTDCPVPTGPGRVLAFTARDMGPMGGPMMAGAGVGPMMLMPRAALVSAGELTIALVNAGSRPHELLVYPLDAGQVAGQRPVGDDDRVSEEGALGDAEAVCPRDTDVDGIVPGGPAAVTLTLAPGTYEVLCNLPGHYRRGMRSTLTSPDRLVGSRGRRRSEDRGVPKGRQ